MKNISKLLMLIIFVTFWNVYRVKATIHIITAAYGPGFTPDTAYVNVGDTIKWQWADPFNMGHTTTMVSGPTGAIAWDEPLNSTDSIFQYVVTISGTYNYHCTFHSFMSSVIIANPTTSVETTSRSHSSVHIFPNPSNGRIYIESGDLDNGTVDVYNLFGERIYSKLFRGINITEIKLPDNAKGTFIVQLTNARKSNFIRVLIN